MLSINGRTPQKKGEFIEVVTPHHKLVYKAVALGSVQMTPHWRFDHSVDAEGNINKTVVDPRYGENKGLWHSTEQETIKNLFDSVTLEEWIYGKTPDQYRIADCYDSKTGTVIEFQHSPMSLEEFKDRCVHYGRADKKLCWVLSSERAFKHSKWFDPSSLEVVENNIVTPVYISKNNIPFFDLSILTKGHNIPVFVDIGWKEHYLQFITIETRDEEHSYKYALFFKVVLKKDIILIAQNPRSYDAIREEVLEHWPLTEELSKLVYERERVGNAMFELHDELNGHQHLLETQAQLDAALEYRGVKQILTLEEFKNTMKAVSELRSGIRSMKHYSSIVLEAPFRFKRMFKDYYLAFFN